MQPWLARIELSEVPLGLWHRVESFPPPFAVQDSCYLKSLKEAEMM